ncbi:MAG: hypothetical protein WCG01_01425 [bacterium]
MKKILIILFFAILIIQTNNVALAGEGGANPGGGVTNSNTSQNVKSSFSAKDFNPLKTIDSLPAYANKLITSLLGVIGSIALIMFTYSGFRWMTAAGNSKAVEESRATMLWAALGLVLIFSSYALVKFVIGAAGG